MQGYDLVLPPRMTESKVEGVVVWPDGSPAINAYIKYQFSEHPGLSAPRYVELDGKTSFSVSLFDGHKYTLYAEIDRDGKRFRSEPVEVTPGANTKSLRLILRE